MTGIWSCVQSGAAPGTIHRLDATETPVPSRFFHYSTHAFSVAQAVELAVQEEQRPSVLFRPVLSKTRGPLLLSWAARYGDSGPVGFGATPDEAIRNFDKAWYAKIKSEDAPGG